MKTLRILTAIFTICALATCAGLDVSGSIGYTDPKTGTVTGIRIGTAPDAKTVKLPSGYSK